jgi:small subunit ribosomal protein S6
MAENAAAAPAAAPAQPLPELPEGVRLYESLWIVDAAYGREDFNKVATEVRETVEKGGGKIVNVDKWEERKLAYPIKKKKRGLYVICHFTAPTQNVTKIDRAARLNELFLRHMILVDEDGLATTPPARVLDDEDFGGDRPRG